MTQEDDVIFKDAITKLPSDASEADAATLVFIEGHTIREAAFKMGIPRSTVWEAVVRMRARAVELKLFVCQDGR